ncbi:MAG: protein translocase subunit SecF [Brevibacterium sp.]|uniref:protein translocase subunit SecF n=1 Tax=Brevibacterium sp. TaxID=1701 RepID=UPI0026483E62|nr:protein translocase subunit SecF [Brevibacterium sp.]MDN5806978.1 protein translocase subunit SecF [Brevibacterium sp.]MDN5832458.1 protein translocase subunit SecF [Brevibacterium sp.]MDN5875057.1 protein translocase subunit SecF [Brevibacterium sp.]MDN5908810.1 protein translocase subunit SecF [Brevibacterium sp.]MDN6133097.1 protein translocase subunit SecF [Brevibacterium sp.]
MKRFFAWGNRLHNGESSIPFVGKAKLWLTITGVLVLLSLLVPLIAGFNFGIAFKGGSQFQIDHVTDTAPQKGQDLVADVVGDAEPRLTPTGDTTVKIETNQLSDDEMQEVRDALVGGYDVKAEDVTSTFVGPEWGQDVTEKMIRALVIFVGIAMIVMALYFRTWKMSMAAIVGLFVVMIVTTGIYSATGFEITPEAVIGFLTVLSFSLYDTVVVFDKIRENTTRFKDKRNLKFSELVNLGVNQTTVRSINTSVVSVLPIASILFIGVFLLGAGTLVDISLSLFIGTIVAAASTLFVASPLYAVLRSNEPAVKEQEEAVRELRLKNGAEDAPPVIHAEV